MKASEYHRLRLLNMEPGGWKSGCSAEDGAWPFLSLKLVLSPERPIVLIRAMPPFVLGTCLSHSALPPGARETLPYSRGLYTTLTSHGVLPVC